jgi:hypothetical protein
MSWIATELLGTRRMHHDHHRAIEAKYLLGDLCCVVAVHLAQPTKLFADRLRRIHSVEDVTREVDVAFRAIIEVRIRGVDRRLPDSVEHRFAQLDLSERAERRREVCERLLHSVERLRRGLTGRRDHDQA